MENKNIIKVYTSSAGAELMISAPATKQVVSATNNRAQYFAEQAKKYRDEAKAHRDNAKFYAEQNSDVTLEHINLLRENLENLISTKQDSGDYALREDLPSKVSELENDSEYVNEEELSQAIEEVTLPEQRGFKNCVLMTDGQNESWVDLKCLKESQITNCITEIPQRIKYTLENGTLTIKAGSVVIIPYGTEDLRADYPVGVSFINDNFKVYDTQFTDGKFFVWTELQIDQSENITTASTAVGYACMSMTNDIIGRRNLESGTASTASKTYTIYYNTDTNRIGVANDNTTIDFVEVFSLPFLIYKSDGTNNYGTIEQVFQGMGYIGTTVWVDKGIKGLIPDGRNEDGTLKNIEFTTTDLKLRTFTNTGACVLLANGIDNLGYVNLSYYEYDKTSNYVYNTYYGRIPSGQMALLNFYADAGVITSFQSKFPFRTVDYNDASALGMPSSRFIDLSVGASGADYIAPANGYFFMRGATSAVGQQIYMYNLNSSLITLNKNPNANSTCYCHIPAKRGETVRISYSVGEVKTFRFIYAEGEV